MLQEELGLSGNGIISHLEQSAASLLAPSSPLCCWNTSLLPKREGGCSNLTAAPPENPPQGITAAGLEFFPALLRKNTALRKINLGMNKLGDPGAKVLAPASSSADVIFSMLRKHVMLQPLLQLFVCRSSPPCWLAATRARSSA